MSDIIKTFVTILGVIIVLALIGYGGYRIYQHFIKNASMQSSGTYQTMRTQPTIMVSNSVYHIMPSEKLGPIFTDIKGRTLYINKHNTNGVSTCIRGCLKAWPAYIAPSQSGSFPSGISV